MLDGAARVEDMVLAAKADGQRAIAITDHGNLYGVIDFYEACRASTRSRRSSAWRPTWRRTRVSTGRRVEERWTIPEATPKAARSLSPLDPPRRDQRGLPKSPGALLDGLSRGLLLQAPSRLGPLGAKRGRPHRDVGLPRGSGAAGPAARRSPKGSRTRGAATDHLRSRELLHRAPRSRHGFPASNEPAASFASPKSYAPRCWPPTTCTTYVRRTPRCTTLFFASAPVRASRIRTGFDLRATSTISSPPRRCATSSGNSPGL